MRVEETEGVPCGEASSANLNFYDDAKEQQHPAFITLTTQLTLSISPDDISYIPKKLDFMHGDE